MPSDRIIVIGASSGGIEALSDVVSRLPEDFPAPVFVVVHVPARSVSVLPDILNRAGPLTAAHAKDNEKIKPGRIYVARPDFHMLIHNGVIRVIRGPKENNTRPAIDPTFRTAARVYGPRVIGVVLSGSLDDGSAGLHAVKQRGGVTIVQDPQDALFPDMPQNAIASVQIDYVVAKDKIAPLLERLAREPVKDVGEAPEDMQKEAEIEAMTMQTDEEKIGEPSVFGCPECGGVLWELHDGEMLRFRCRVGHGYTAEGLLSEQSEALDQALWSAYRALEENASLARRLTERAKKNQGNRMIVKRFEQRARDAQEQAETIKKLLQSGKLAEPVEKSDVTE